MKLLNNTNCATIDGFRNQVYSVSLSVISVIGFLGNGLALVLLLRSYHHRSTFQVYMLNLAVSDLLCMCTLPLRILYYTNNAQWNQGDLLCRVSSYFLYVNLYCSIFFLTAMSVTRFLAIVFPVQNLTLVTQCRARLVCLCIWVFVCAVSSPFLLTGQIVDANTNRTRCFDPPEGGKDVGKLIILNYISFVVGFALPFLIIVLCYGGIIRTLLSRKVSAQRKSAGRSIRMIVIIMLTFLVSFMPYHVQRSLHLSFLSDNASCEQLRRVQKSVVVTLCLAASNSCFDPLLYFFSGEGFRRRLSSLRTSIRGSTRKQTMQLHLMTVPGTEEGAENTQTKGSGPSPKRRMKS